MLPDPSLGEVARWGLIFGAIAYAAMRRMGEPAAVVAAALAALGIKAALLGIG